MPKPRRRRLLAATFGLLVAAFHANGQGAQVLVTEVLSREFSISVGDAQSESGKEVSSREYSIFAGGRAGGEIGEVVSRETSVLVTTPTAPAPVAALTLAASPTGQMVALSWSGYNEWAQFDVGHYAVYVSPVPFTNVSLLTPYTNVPAGTFSLTLNDLPANRDQYFAVVAVDVNGAFSPGVTEAASYSLGREVVSRELSVFVGADGQLKPSELVSRETSLLVLPAALPAPINQLTVVASPTGQSALLSWSGYNEWAQNDVVGYNIYVSGVPVTNVSGLTPFETVPAGTFSASLTGLTAAQDHYFAVAPVDATGRVNASVSYVSSYTLVSELVSREATIFVGGNAQPTDREVVSREWSILVPAASIPAPVTGVGSGFTAATSTNAYAAIDLGWPNYNEVGQSDVVRYRVYAEPAFFTNVNGVMPISFAPAGLSQRVLTGLQPGGIYYVAVVAEDALGRWNPSVRSVSAQASESALGEVQNLQVISGSNSLAFSWQPPTGGDIFLAAYDVYFGGAATPVALSPTSLSFVASSLAPATGYPFRVTTVDTFGVESAGSSVVAATLLANPTNLMAQPGDGFVHLTWSPAQPASLVQGYSVYVSPAPFTSVSGVTPFLTTAGLEADVLSLPNDTPYYFAVATVNISGGESAGVQPIVSSAHVINAVYAILVPTNVMAPPSAYPGAPAPFGWRVVNDGTGPTTLPNGNPSFSWTDRILLSPRGSLSESDNVIVEDLPHLGAVNSGASYSANVTVAVPRASLGVYQVLVESDALAEIFQGSGVGPHAAAAPQLLRLGLTTPLPDQTIQALRTLVVTNTPLISGLPPGRLTFALGRAPAGMTINATNGVLDWTPTAAQGPSINFVSVVATDHGSPPLSETNSFVVFVNHASGGLSLQSPPNFNVQVGQSVSFTAVATDSAAPSASLVFQLTAGPAGASINQSSGAFLWKPSAAQAGTTNTFTIQVTDNSAPPLADSKSFEVVVASLSPVVILPQSYVDGVFTVSVIGPVGPGYVLLEGPSVTQGPWTPVITNTPSSVPFSLSRTNRSAVDQFYRVVLQ